MVSVANLPLKSAYEREAAIVKHADHFIVYDPATSSKKTFKALLEAVREATPNRRAMLYAVLTEHCDAYLETKDWKRYLALRGEVQFFPEIKVGKVYQTLMGRLVQVLAIPGTSTEEIVIRDLTPRTPSWEYLPQSSVVQEWTSAIPKGLKKAKNVK